MDNCHKLVLSVTSKLYIFEDRTVEPTKYLNGLSDNNKDFIELSHQDGAHQERCTQGLRDYKQRH